MADEWERTGETVEELRGSAADDGWERTGEVAPPAKPAKPKTAFDSMPSAAQQSQAIMGVVGQQISDPKSTTRFAADRAANAAASVPGLPADILNIIAQHTPTVEDAAYIPFIGPAVAMERARIDREGADAMVPLGGENIRAAGQDLGVLPKPRAPEGIGEKWLGNVADFAGGSVAPFGFAKSLVPAVGGATGFTAAQEMFPDSPAAQFIAALIGAGTPAGVKAAASRGKAAAQPFTAPFTGKGQRAAAGDILREAGAKPVPEAEWAQAEIPGVTPTTGQAFGDESILKIQRAVQDKTGDIYRPFKENVNQNRTALRGAIEELRGSGLPEEARLFAENKLNEATRALDETLEMVGSPMLRLEDASSARALSAQGAHERLMSKIAAIRDEESALFETGWAERGKVNAAEVKQVLDNTLAAEGEFYAGLMPPKVKAALQRLVGETDEALEGVEIIRAGEPPTSAAETLVPIKKIAPIQTNLREEAQKAARAGDKDTARVLGNMERALGDYIDSLDFGDDTIKAGRDKARAFSKERAALIDRVPEMQEFLSKTAKGGQNVSPEETLGVFIKPDATGKATVRALLSLDNTPEMHRLVQDFLLAKMPQNAQKSMEYIEKYGGVLSELPMVRGNLLRVAERQAFHEALRKSPLGQLANQPPENMAGWLMSQPDGARLAQQLQQQLGGETSPAWAAMKSAYVDRMIKGLENLDTNALDLEGRGSLKATAMSKFVRDFRPLNEVMLGSRGTALLDKIERSAALVNRRATTVGSPTAPILATEKFLDKTVQDLIVNRLPWPARNYLGWLYQNAEERTHALLAQALLDPKLANDLMQEATERGLKKVRPGIRPWLDSLKRNARVGLGTHAAQTSAAVAPPPPERVDNAIPEQPFGAEAIPLQPAPLASNDDEANEPGAWLAK